VSTSIVRTAMSRPVGATVPSGEAYGPTVPPAHLERDHHPVGRFHRVQDVHAELIEGLLQRPGPGHERGEAHLGAVDQDRIRVHLAERGLGIARPSTGSVHSGNRRSSRAIMASSLYDGN
jgi:hypothetical protein